MSVSQDDVAVPFRSRSDYIAVLMTIATGLGLLLFTVSLNRRFDHDEFEHIHSAWYVTHHYTPYVDFFQHHHPLLWYLMAPVLLVLGDTIQSIIALRIGMFLMTVGIGWALYRLTRTLSLSPESGWLAVILLFSMSMFTEKSLEIRPDVPQVLFGLVSIEYLIRFFRERKDRDMMVSGLAAAVSFLFLQKTVFLLAAYAVIFLWDWARRSRSFRPVLLFAVSSGLPVILYGSWLACRGSFPDYFLTNWRVNAHYLISFSSFPYLSKSIHQNVAFWALVPLSSLYFLSRRKTTRELRIVMFIGWVLLLSVWYVGRPYRQYYMFAIPVFCAVSAAFVGDAFDRLRVPRGLRLGIVLLMVFPPALLLRPAAIVCNGGQLARIDFVLKNSDPTDRMYDGDCQFNLYRGDLHYFWYQVAPNLAKDALNRLTDGRYADYDIVPLIHQRKPKFISHYLLDLRSTGLDALYVPTPYAGLYIRK